MARTQSIGSSIRLYRESLTTPLRLERNQRVEPPLGFVVFPKETVTPPREWIERGYNLRRFTHVSVGGHFAALEQPELFAADVRGFIACLEGGETESVRANSVGAAKSPARERP